MSPILTSLGIRLTLSVFGGSRWTLLNDLGVYGILNKLGVEGILNGYGVSGFVIIFGVFKTLGLSIVGFILLIFLTCIFSNGSSIGLRNVFRLMLPSDFIKSLL